MLNRISILMLPLLLLSFPTSLSAFKFNKVSCVVYNKNFINVTRCQLKAVKRNVAEFSFRGMLLNPPVHHFHVHMQLLRKYTIYRPFFVNFTIDACEFLRKTERYPIPSVFYNAFEKYSNINHTCPYEGEIIIEKYAPASNSKFLPVPTADYLIKTDWILNGVNQLSVNLWLTYEEPK